MSYLSYVVKTHSNKLKKKKNTTENMKLVFIFRIFYLHIYFYVNFPITNVAMHERLIWLKKNVKNFLCHKFDLDNMKVPISIANGI